MTDLFAMLAFACSFITATITLVEWFLSEQQKQYLHNVAIGVWNTLDDVKKQRVVLDLRASTPQWVLGILSLTFSVIFMSAVYGEKRSSEPEIFWTFVASLFVSVILIMSWLLPSLQQLISKNRGMESYAWTVFRIWFGTIVIYFLWVIIFLNVFVNATGGAGLVGVFLDVLITTGRNTVIALIYLIILSKISFLVWPPVVAGEIVMRRIAESSQGPLLAIAGLSSAMGTFLKLFVD
jgi:hypothetical protein